MRIRIVAISVIAAVTGIVAASPMGSAAEVTKNVERRGVWSYGTSVLGGLTPYAYSNLWAPNDDHGSTVCVRGSCHRPWVPAGETSKAWVRWYQPIGLKPSYYYRYTQSGK